MKSDMTKCCVKARRTSVTSESLANKVLVQQAMLSKLYARKTGKRTFHGIYSPNFEFFSIGSMHPYETRSNIVSIPMTTCKSRKCVLKMETELDVVVQWLPRPSLKQGEMIRFLLENYNTNI